MNKKQLVLVGADGSVLKTLTGFVTLRETRELLTACGWMRTDNPHGLLYWGFIAV